MCDGPICGSQHLAAYQPDDNSAVEGGGDAEEITQLRHSGVVETAKGFSCTVGRPQPAIYPSIGYPIVEALYETPKHFAVLFRQRPMTWELIDMVSDVAYRDRWTKPGDCTSTPFISPKLGLNWPPVSLAKAYQIMPRQKGEYWLLTSCQVKACQGKGHTKGIESPPVPCGMA